MTVKELIAQLAKMPDSAEVMLRIGNPKDAAYTNDMADVSLKDNGQVVLDGWVASDNEEAFAPWSQ